MAGLVSNLPHNGCYVGLKPALPVWRQDIFSTVLIRIVLTTAKFVEKYPINFLLRHLSCSL